MARTPSKSEPVLKPPVDGARDPLEMTVRELLAAAISAGSRASGDDWINIRGEAYPWKRIVAAAERGECEVSRVGRRLMMQRSELAKFLAARRISPKKKEADAKPKPKGEFGDSVQRALKRNGLA